MNLPEYESSIWPFLTILFSLVAAVLGVGIGYVLTLWQNRLLPWITIHSFSTMTASNETVRLQDSLVAAAERSWIGVPLNADSRLSVVQSANNAAKSFLATNTGTAGTIDVALERLRATEDLTEIRAALLPVLTHSGVKDILWRAIWRDELDTPTDDPTAPVYLSYDMRQDVGNGTFVIDFPNIRATFGKNLVAERIMLAKVSPFIIMFCKLRRDEIMETLAALHPLLREQVRLAQLVADDTQSLIDKSSRWTAEFSITNYGSGPMVVFTDNAGLWISGTRMKRFWIPSHLTYRSADGAWTRQTGVFLVPSGVTHLYRLVTNSTQSELRLRGEAVGQTIWEVWKSEQAAGNIKIKIRGRQLPWSRMARGDELPFRNAVP